MKRTTIAIDLAKNVFEVALANSRGRILERHRFSRSQFTSFVDGLQPADVVMEACGSAHHWGRVLAARHHRVSLLPPHYVRPYVRRNKTDRSDVEALLEANRSGQIPTVAIRSVRQQEIMALHRVRSAWVSTRTARINALRGFLSELGLPIPAGAKIAITQAAQLVETDSAPRAMSATIRIVLEEIDDVNTRIQTVECMLRGIARDDDTVSRLLQIPGVGLLTATAIVGSVGNICAFPTARHFASWLGLTPREYSSGSSRRLGRITKQGNVYLRCLLTHGARAALLAARRSEQAGKRLTGMQRWTVALHRRAGHNKTAIAMANKTARIIWAVWSKDERFQRERKVA